MSYDVEVTVHHADGYKTVVGDFNITSNLRAMFVAAGLPDSLNTLRGKTAVEAADLLYPVWHELRTRPDVYRAYDSPNGWGLHKNALPFIRELYLTCRLHPLAVITV